MSIIQTLSLLNSLEGSFLIKNIAEYPFSFFSSLVEPWILAGHVDTQNKDYIPSVPWRSMWPCDKFWKMEYMEKLCVQICPPSFWLARMGM